MTTLMRRESLFGGVRPSSLIWIHNDSAGPDRQRSRAARRRRGRAPRFAARAGRRPAGRRRSSRSASATCARSATARPGCGSILGDSSGTLEAVSWEDAEALLRARRARRRGPRHRQLRGQRALGREDQDRRAARRRPGEEYRPRTSPPARGAGRALEADLRQLMETIQDPQLRELLSRFFGAELAELGALPRGAGGQALPPGLPARAARAHALGRPGGQCRGRLLPRHRPRRRGHRRAAARHRQDRGLQRRPAGDRPHRRRPPPGRDPARLLPGPPRDRGDRRLRPRARPGASSTSSSATTARSSTARRSSPAPARRCSST